MNGDSEKASDVLKDPDAAHPVPRPWRPALSHLVETIAGMHPDEEPGLSTRGDLIWWRSNIANYGVVIGGIPQEGWESSVAQWMDGHWDVLVDLYTKEGERTDLVMAVQVFETATGYEYRVDSVHVP